MIRRRAHMTVKLRRQRGPEAKRRAAKRRQIARVERAAKVAAKERDGYCCRRCGRWSSIIEAAHITNAGAGGDPQLLRGGKRSDFVSLCYGCHQGPASVHSGHLEMVCGPDRGDGHVTFREKKPVVDVPRPMREGVA